VVGYASLDYVVRLDAAPRSDRTSRIVARAGEWSRLGGSPAYVAAALVAAGVGEATLLSWVGDDCEGERYRPSLADIGIDAKGVSFRPGNATVCILAYEPNVGCRCFYDPSFRHEPELDESQRALIATARQGRPRKLSRWSAPTPQWPGWSRRPPVASPEALAGRADIVIFSRGGAPFV